MKRKIYQFCLTATLLFSGSIFATPWMPSATQRLAYLEKSLSRLLSDQGSRFVLEPDTIEMSRSLGETPENLLSLGDAGIARFSVTFVVHNQAGRRFYTSDMTLTVSNYPWVLKRTDEDPSYFSQKITEPYSGKTFSIELRGNSTTGSPKSADDYELKFSPL